MRRWEHEHVLERVQERLDEDPTQLAVRSMTDEHPYGTIKSWMGAHALQDAHPEKRRHRDGTARTCLQHDPRDEDHGRTGHDCSHVCLSGLV